MTVGKHGRLTYKRGTMDLSKLLDDQVVSRSAGEKENMLVTGKFGTQFSRNRLIFASLRKQTSAGRTAGPCAVPSRQNNIARTRLSACRKTTFLELCVEK